MFEIPLNLIDNLRDCEPEQGVMWVSFRPATASDYCLPTKKSQKEAATEETTQK